MTQNGPSSLLVEIIHESLGMNLINSFIILSTKDKEK